MLKTYPYFKLSIKGVTLLELMVGIAIASVVLIGAMKVFTSQQEAYSTQVNLTALQQSVRSGMNILLDDIQMAGFYTKIDKRSYSDYIDWDPSTGGEDSFQPVIYGRNNLTGYAGYNDGSDIILLVKGSKERHSQLGADGAIADTQTLTFVDTDAALDFNTDKTFKRKYGMIINSNLNIAQLFKIEAITPGNPITLTTKDVFQNDFYSDSIITRVDMIVYRVGTNSYLERRNFGDDNGFFHAVAENIADLQFSYSLNDGTTVSDPTGNENKIRKITVTLTGSVSIPRVGLSSTRWVKRVQQTSTVEARNLML